MLNTRRNIHVAVEEVFDEIISKFQKIDII